MGAIKKKWMCAQLGAREHYAIPRALQQEGQLEVLYTDFWARPGLRKLYMPGLRPLASRHHLELNSAKIISWNLKTVWWELLAKAKRRKQKADAGNRYREFIEIGRQFASAVREDLKRRNPKPENTIFFGYDTGSLETLEWCRERGIKCVVDQMDPNRFEVNLVREEETRWPEWTLGRNSEKSVVGGPWSVVSDDMEQYFQRREQEWAMADRVVVNSRWSLEALIQQGVPREKMVIIPLCYESDHPASKTGPVVSGQWSGGSRQQPLRVLFLGQVILRKGIQYLIEAAKLVQNEPVQFDVVGPIGISEIAVNSAPKNVRFHGRATRDQTGRWYAQADVFVLPTLSDGFALTQIEAMAHGLPVIATPNCGEVVADGVDGFIVPARDAIALAQVIQNYLNEPDLLKSHRVVALEKSKQFSMARLQKSLESLEQSLTAP